MAVGVDNEAEFFGELEVGRWVIGFCGCGRRVCWIY